MTDQDADTARDARQAAPCGSWSSTFGIDMVAGGVRGLSTPRADADMLYWLEARPEQGRTVLCRCGVPGGAIEDVTDDRFDVGSRVHEYGGGAYAVQAGRIAFSHRIDGSIWLIEPGCKARRLVATPGLRHADLNFTPDGLGLLAVREDHRHPGEPRAGIVLLPLDAEDDQAEGVVLVSGPDFLSSPRLAPDGSRLAWIEWDHPDMPWERTRLLEARFERQGGVAKISACRRLAGADRAEALLQPGFSADGVLHVCSDRNGWWNLFRVQGETLVAVCPMHRETGVPPWVFGQRSYGFMPDGSLIAAVVEEGRTSAVHILDGEAHALPIGGVVECPVVLAPREDGNVDLAWVRAMPAQPAALMYGRMSAAASVITQAHGIGNGAADISVAEAIHYPTADGGRGHAFFYAPASSRFRAAEGERPPLMVIVHGGPTGMTSDALSLRVQWWTSRGIAVVDVNYGGSTGFGRGYRERLDGGWGIVDVDDCIAACAALVEAGRVDVSRIAIRGSSAGGFTVLAALVRSSMFAAGTCIYGIGDLTMLSEETHKFEAHYLDRLIGRLPEAAATYAARSPINHLDALACPVIFFHGTLDKVVPISQARAMAQAMRERGIPYALHEFEGEGHGFRRAETMRRVLELELAFYGEVFGFTPAAP